MHQYEVHRLRHRSTLRTATRLVPSLFGVIALITTAAPAQVSSQPPTPAPGTTQPQTAPQLPLQPRTVRIRIVNAKTNQPVTDEHLNVALAAAQIGSVAMPANKYGIVLVHTGTASTVRILSNFYADCRPRGELYTDYPLATINATGIATGNLCSAAHPVPRPGELLLYVIPRTYIPKAGDAPNTNLPHSDEFPQ